MFDTLTLLTLTLARGFGVLILAVSLLALVTPGRLSAALADFERSPGLTLLGAITALIMGLVLITLHNLWTDPLAILVSLLCWACLVKGVLLLAAPTGYLKFGAAIAASPSRIRIYGVVALILGAILLAAGLLGRASIGL